MGKFYAPKKLLIEDFPAEQRSYLGKLLDPLNQFMQQVATALSQGLVFVDNFKAIKFSVNIAASQTYPLEYNLAALKDRPSAVIIGEVIRSDEAALSSAYSVHWKYDNGMLRYTLIGLDATKSHTVTILVLV